MSTAPIEVRSVGEREGAVCLRFTGAIDERFDVGQLHRSVGAVTILDLGDVSWITSFGVRQWKQAMKSMPAEVRRLYLVRCPPCFVDNLNMVLNFGGRAEVLTATLTYFCDRCQQERPVSIDVFGERDKLENGIAPPGVCSECQGPLQLQEDPRRYLRFAGNYGAKSIDPAAEGLLAQIGLYRVREARRSPPEEVKLVHGDVTLFLISGTLDRRFRPQRLILGLEGDVVFDLGAVEGTEAAGMDNWRQMLEALKSVRSVTLFVHLPEPLFAEVAGGQFATANARLHSFKPSYRCATCGESLRASLPASRPTTSAGPPCPRCEKRTALTAAPTLLDEARARFVPGYASPEVRQVIEQRDELMARARAEDGEAEPAAARKTYKVVRPLGHGEVAEVLVALQQGIGGFEKRVVLKKIHREALARRGVALEPLLAGARLSTNLNHANIVQVFEVDDDPQEIVVVMEYVHGVDLRTLVDEGKRQKAPLSVDEVLFIGQKVAEALHHAHRATDVSGTPLGIVHGNVSPGNILIGFDGQVKLADVGLTLPPPVGIEEKGVRVAHRSPEQLQGTPIDARSDLFALAAVLYEALLGKPLFRRDTDLATSEAVRTATPPPLQGQAEVQAVLRQALAKSPTDRPADARAFEQALAGCLRQLQSTIDPRTLADRIRTLVPDTPTPGASRSSSDLAVRPQPTEPRPTTNPAVQPMEGVSTVPDLAPQELPAAIPAPSTPGFLPAATRGGRGTLALLIVCTALIALYLIFGAR